MKSILIAVCIFLPALLSSEPLCRDIFPYIRGWQSVKDETVYNSDNLFDLIDGAAEVFLSYGFVDLNITEYQKEGLNPVRVELYRHNSRANAFGMYATERQPKYHFVDVGTQGYIEDGVLNFLIGIYYVKITTDEPKESGRQTMMMAAQAVAGFVRQEKGFPSALELFPGERKNVNSEGYIAENFLGYKFFRSAYTAQYEDTARIQLFIIQLDSVAHAVEMVATAMREFKQPPRGTVKDGAYLLNDPHTGAIHLLLSGKTLCGVTQCADAKKAKRYLDLLKKSLRTQKK